MSPRGEIANPRALIKTPGGGSVNQLREARLDDDSLKEGSALSSAVKVSLREVVDDDGMSVGACLAVQMRRVR